jgi:hypothetical protein
MRLAKLVAVQKLLIYAGLSSEALAKEEAKRPGDN